MAVTTENLQPKLTYASPRLTLSESVLKCTSTSGVWCT